MTEELQLRAINTIRFLSADAIQRCPHAMLTDAKTQITPHAIILLEIASLIEFCVI